jgi:hypothetical protein
MRITAAPGAMLADRLRPRPLPAVQRSSSFVDQATDEVGARLSALGRPATTIDGVEAYSEDEAWACETATAGSGSGHRTADRCLYLRPSRGMPMGRWMSRAIRTHDRTATP